MTWCPICKKEYEHGGLCPDCSAELLNGSPDDFEDFFAFSNEEAALSIYNHLLEIGFETVQYYYHPEENAYHLICDPSETEAAKQQLVFFCEKFFTEDRLSTDMTADQRAALLKLTDDIIADESRAESSHSYVSAQEKYANVSSSAVSLLIVGIIGLIILLTDVTGIYQFPFSGSSRILFIFTMGLLFVVFVIAGIISLRNARKLSKDIVHEDNVQENIRAYITGELDLSHADDAIDADTPPEEKYLVRTGYITTMVKQKFPSADEAFIDHIAESMYDSLFSEN